jgi:hypothetical protein
MRRLPVHFPCAPRGFLFDHGHTSPVHLYIENRNRCSHNDRQMQLQRLFHGVVFTAGDIGADGFGGTFDGFGGYFETGE